MQPLVLSPKVWMCMPRLALASLPVMSQVMVVGADSEACSKVTVPETLESPRTTATVVEGQLLQQGRHDAASSSVCRSVSRRRGIIEEP